MARQATVQQVARQVLWTKHEFPFSTVLVAKRDVARAFHWLWVRSEDLWMFASDLPGESWGLDSDLTILNLVLTFGWGSRLGNTRSRRMW